MTAQSPGAYGISALIHASVFGLILFFSYASMSVVKDTPKVLELVAGGGDNYMATEAPALGSPGGIKMAPLPVARPAPTAPPAAPAPKAEASPIQSAPEKAPPPVPDLVKQLERTEKRREARLEKKYQKAKEEEQKRLAAQLKAERAAAHVDSEGIAAGVLGGSTSNKTGGAGGKALSREEASELDAYFSMLKSRIKQNHTPPEGVSDSLAARVEFMLSADGSLSHVRIVKSSGNAEFDRTVVDACQRTSSNPPRPDHRSEPLEMTFRMHDEESQ